MSDVILTRLYQVDYPVQPDDYDKGMVDAYLRQWNSHYVNSPDIPRVGDYVIMLDGSIERAAHVWDDAVQTCISGSFALDNGYASMSGSLNPGIPKEKLINTGNTKQGDFWVFHHNHWMAHNAIGVTCSCRVFKVI
jgi:hypothetical protein